MTRQREMNPPGEDAAGQTAGTSANTSSQDAGEINNDIDEIIEMNEQYRIMAQMEANIRVKDNTGFDMEEYKQRIRLQEEERRRQPQEPAPYHTKSKPMLPDIQQPDFAGGFGDSGKGSARPQEPPLPFTRANRRYIRSGRSNNGRPEIYLGIVVPQDSAALATASNSTERTVTCWGCSGISGIYLRVDALATLVQCPECYTISPIM